MQRFVRNIIVHISLDSPASFCAASLKNCKAKNKEGNFHKTNQAGRYLVHEKIDVFLS